MASEQKQIDELRKTIKSSTTDIQTQVERQKDLTIVNIAGTFTLLSAIVTMFHMSSHLKSMNQPSIQKKIMAILWMSPVYGITSFLSLLAPSAEGYLGIVKDFYEACNWMNKIVHTADRTPIALTLRNRRMLTIQLLLLALGVNGAEFCEDSSSSSSLGTCWFRLNILYGRCSFQQQLRF